jgi:enamine deaminase RidA (YjgF/YER057c/UK114 family)
MGQQTGAASPSRDPDDSASRRYAWDTFQQTWGSRRNPPAITVAIVAALANPQFLLEIDATAVVPSD